MCVTDNFLSARVLHELGTDASTAFKLHASLGKPRCVCSVLETTCAMRILANGMPIIEIAVLAQLIVLVFLLDCFVAAVLVPSLSGDLYVDPCLMFSACALNTCSGCARLRTRALFALVGPGAAQRHRTCAGP